MGRPIECRHRDDLRPGRDRHWVGRGPNGNGHRDHQSQRLRRWVCDRQRIRIVGHGRRQHEGQRPGSSAISRIDLKKKGKASVYYTPGSDGGAPILGATATCKPVKKGDTRTATGTSAPLKIKKLKKKASYKCTVSVINAVGASPASAKKTIKAK